MEKDVLKVGLKISDARNVEWRIIYVDEFRVRLIRLNSSVRDIQTIDKSKMIEDLGRGYYSISMNQEIYVVDVSSLVEKAKESFMVRKNLIRDVYETFGPSFFELTGTRSTFSVKLDELSEKYGMGKVTAYRIVLRWLQSGMQDSALVDMRYAKKTMVNSRNIHTKLGRKSEFKQGVVIDEVVLGYFEEALDYYKHNRVASYRDAYVRMVLKHYSSITNEGIQLVPDDEMPTERQLNYFISKNMTYKEKKIKETSVAEYRNSNRLLLSSPRADALRPGWIVEVDALEVDLQIVSSSVVNQNVGKPIVYFMLDIYSHGIVAFSVGYENNSNLGLSDLLLNLFDDKTKIFNAYGIKCNDSLIPSRFIPHEIRCDRGSDFKSDYFLRVCSELGIMRSLVTGATGSLKGSVEQSFRQFQKTIRPSLLNLGIVQPRYDSNHYEEAVLILEDTLKLVLSFVAFYNTRSIKGLKLTPQMMHEGCSKTPISIWNYGVSEKGAPEPVSEANYNKVLYTLLNDDTATISRKGILYKGLSYSSGTDVELLERMRRSKMNANKKTKDGEKLNSLSIRVDPRSINSLFYLKDGNICILELIPSLNPVRDMSWSKYSRYADYDRILEKKGKRENLRNSVGIAAIVETVASEAVDRSNGLKPVSSGITESRRCEKENKNFDNRVETRIAEADEIHPSVTVEESDIIEIDEVANDVGISNIETNLMPNECPEDIKDLFD